MSSSTSSRSSISSSASERMYSPQQLLQLALSRGSQSTTAASATFLQLHAARFLPVADILVESDVDADSASSGYNSNTSSMSSSSDEEEEEESDSEHEHEEEDEFVYGEGVLRSDLSLELIEELKEAVHSALDEASFNLPSSEPTEPVGPLRVYVSANPQRQRQFRHPIVASDSSWRSNNTNQQRRAAPNATAGGAPRRTVPVSLPNSNTTTAAMNSSINPQMDSWRSTLRARRMETTRDWRPSISKEAATTSWRRTQSVWNDAAGSYVVMKA